MVQPGATWYKTGVIVPKGRTFGDLWEAREAYFAFFGASHRAIRITIGLARFLRRDTDGQGSSEEAVQAAVPAVGAVRIKTRLGAEDIPSRQPSANTLCSVEPGARPDVRLISMV